MKLLTIVFVLLLAGCDGSYTEETPAQSAANMMMQNYFLSPRSCTNIGGIVTCQ